MDFDFPRDITNTLARLRTDNYKGMKTLPGGTRARPYCKNCPETQLIPKHTTDILKIGLLPDRDLLRETLYISEAPSLAAVVLQTFDNIKDSLNNPWTRHHHHHQVISAAKSKFTFSENNKSRIN